MRKGSRRALCGGPEGVRSLKQERAGLLRGRSWRMLGREVGVTQGRPCKPDSRTQSRRPTQIRCTCSSEHCACRVGWIAVGMEEAAREDLRETTVARTKVAAVGLEGSGQTLKRHAHKVWWVLETEAQHLGRGSAGSSPLSWVKRMSCPERKRPAWPRIHGDGSPKVPGSRRL